MIDRRIDWWARIQLAAYATVSAIVISLAAGYLQEGRYQLAAGLAGIFFLITVLWGVPAVHRALLETRARVWYRDDGPKARGAVLTISLLFGLDNPESSAAKCLDLALEKARTATTDDAKKQVLEELCDPAGPLSRWSWQQSLRVIRHHFDNLGLVCAIVSNEVAEADQDKRFEKLVALLLPDGAGFERMARPVVMFDYNAVAEAIEAGIKLCTTKLACKERDVCVDITSGTAAYSAAATVKTLNSDVTFSYIHTHGPKVGKVFVYDAAVAN